MGLTNYLWGTSKPEKEEEDKINTIKKKMMMKKSNEEIKKEEEQLPYKKYEEGIRIRKAKHKREGRDQHGILRKIRTKSMKKLKEESEKGNVNVLVIGGGMAGVTAMTTINAGNAKAWLVEASSVLGGKCQSIEIEDEEEDKHILNIGATFIGRGHKATQKLLTDIYKQYEERMIPMWGEERENKEGKAVTMVSQKREEHLNDIKINYKEQGIHNNPFNKYTAIPPQWDKTTEDIPLNILMNQIDLIGQMIQESDIQMKKSKKFKKTIIPLLEEIDSMTVEQWIEQQTIATEKTKNIFRMTASNVTQGANLNEVSMLAFAYHLKKNGGMTYAMDRGPWGNKAYVLNDSFQTVINTMAMEPANDGRIVLNAPVKKIDYEEQTKGAYKKAVVTFKDNTTIVADYVIVAMAPETAGRHIDFTKLEQQRKESMSAARLTQDASLTMNFVYDVPFWRGDDDDDDDDVFNGYVAAWGNTLRHTKRYGDSQPFITQVMDVSIDKENIFMLRVTFDATSVKALHDASLETIKRVCFRHFYEAFNLDPSMIEDKLIVQGSNLKATFGSLWDNKQIVGTAMSLERTNVLMKQHQFGIRGKSDHSRDLPLFFACSDMSTVFPGTISGALTSGATTALALLTLLREKDDSVVIQPEPFYKLAHEHAAFEKHEGVPGAPKGLPHGYRASPGVPTMTAYGRYQHFMKLLQDLQNEEVDTFESSSIAMNRLSSALALSMNPTANKQTFEAIPPLDKAKAANAFWNQGNMDAFLQLLADDCTLDIRGFKKDNVLPFLGTWQGNDPLDAHSVFAGIQQLNLTFDRLIEDQQILQNNGHATLVTFFGPILYIPHQHELTEQSKEGVDYASMQTFIKYTINPITGFIDAIQMIGDISHLYTLAVSQ